MNMFDAIIIAITLLLAIKGFFNGFLKEIAGLVGIVGGLYLAAVYYHPAGVYINNHLITIKNPSAIDLIGFISVFLGFWIFAVFVGFLLSKILKISSLGIIDRILGLIFSAAKFFLLVSIIVALLYKIDFVKEKMQKIYKNSRLVPIMVKIGDKIININPKEIEKNIKNVKIPHINLKGD